MPSRVRIFNRRFDVLDFIGTLLSFATLLVIVYYGILYQRGVRPPFDFEPQTWRVVSVEEECWEDCEEGNCEDACPQVDDILLRIGDLTREDGLRSRAIPIYRPFRDDAPVEVEIERDGQRQVLQIRAKKFRESLVVSAAFFFPMMLWGMGTISLIFLRPRNERWLVLVLFQYDTALWIASGFLSKSGEAYSAVLYHVFIWFFLPLIVHLHLLLPEALFQRHHRKLLVPIYSVALLLLVLDQFMLLGPGVPQLTTLIGISLALLLLFLRQFSPMVPRDRVASRLMLYGVGFGLGPIILVLILNLLGLQQYMTSVVFYFIAGAFLVISPIWPLTYMYVIYRHQEGTFEFRANRLLGTYGFVSLFLMGFPFAYDIAARWWETQELSQAFLGLLFSMISVVMAPILYSAFQRFVDRQIFKIKYRPNEVISVFAERIPSAFGIHALEKVIVDEILPTLLIRQSGLYEIRQGRLSSIYEKQVSEEERPVNPEELSELLGVVGRYIEYSNRTGGKFSWVRLAIPLTIQDHLVGLWLLGRRDPDDYYPRSDIALLSNLANQIAPVVQNFRLVEQAQQEVEENRRLQQQLVHSQKMEAIGRLSAGVAHDFNNILSVIIGYSNLVLVQYGQNEGLRTAVSSIKDAGERAASLTKQLLTFSRKQVMEVRIVNLNEVVREVEKMLRRLAGEDIELTTRTCRDLPNVKVDPGQMGQAIINLAVNARDAMPDGGELLISTERVEKDTEGGDCHEGVPEGAYVRLRVKDSGTGIEPELLGRVFEPYFTTKEHGKGTGLGLSMAYAFIDQCSGYIFVDSEVGQGTEFSIYLPEVPQEEVQKERESRRVVTAFGGSETILLVEDEESVRAVTSEILTSNGYEVVQASNGDEALEEFAHRGDEVDLLLTDVVMPHMKGTELARRLLESKSGLKVIYMSGYNEESILGRRIGEEGSTLIQKPFAPQDLTRRIRETLDQDSQPASEKIPKLEPSKSGLRLDA